MDDVINFSDFLKDKDKNQKKDTFNKEEIMKDFFLRENEEEVKDVDPPIEEESPILENIQIEEDSNENPVQEESSKYKVYKDKIETFTCTMEVEGVSYNNTKVRLVLESDDWNLVFNGDVDSSGKVSIPIKKLNILNEGSTGSIRMEVLADDNIFIPWQDEFEVKLSKKVTIKLDEKLIPKPQPKPNNPTVKVHLKN